jgi:hypothetical protein
MKRILPLMCTCVCLLVLSSSSQVVSRKDKLFGVAASVSYYNNNQPPSNSGSQQYSNVALIPSYGWAVIDNVVIGVKGNFSYGSTKYETPLQKQKSSALQAGPEFYLKKYKLLRDRFGLLFNHSIYASYTRQKSEIVGQTSSNSKVWGGGYNFTPGAFYKFSERFLGEANIGGLFADYTYNNGGKTYSIGASFLRYFNLGVQYIIPGKRS